MPSDPEIKQSVLDTAKAMVECGLVEGTAGNVSARLPGGRVVLTPSSLDYDSMTLEDLVVTDAEGKVLEGDRPPTTEKALHLACLRQYEDIGAVMHCHALFASMFAVNHEPIPCVIEEFDIYVGGEVPVAEYRLTGSDELAGEASRWLGDRAAVLMANHGLLCVGKDSGHTLKIAQLVERTAQLVWGARMMGEPVPLPESTLEKFAPIYKVVGRLR
ncbi:MAG: fuculose phosphate aldolase [bacterium]|nr:fuculose phosphate aldolase [Deltaproteobacteria bacterium]MCP4908317.1 fuculose phosphate aldolase [bacterium]